tara:strand:+ start:317 stop:775 length:459 start_codon:yes stop_codon:yes gene_type:complete
MKNQTTATWICESADSNARVLPDHYDNAMIGILFDTSQVVYDYDSLVSEVAKEMPDLAYDDVLDHISFNIIGGASPEWGPTFVNLIGQARGVTPWERENLSDILGGKGTDFYCKLYRLISHGDGPNRAMLKKSYPEQVNAVLEWEAVDASEK